MSEELESIEQRIRDAVRDLQEWRRRQEQQAVERMSPEERRAKVRKWSRDLGRGGAAVIVIGLLAAVRVVHEVNHHPLRVAAVAVLVTAAVLAVRPPTGEPEENLVEPPRAIGTPTFSPTPSPASPTPNGPQTPSPTPTLGAVPNETQTELANAEPPTGVEPAPSSPTREPTSILRPTVMPEPPEPSPSPTQPSPTRTPTPTRSPTPTPTPTPTPPPRECTLEVTVDDLLDLCVDVPLLAVFAGSRM